MPTSSAANSLTYLRCWGDKAASTGGDTAISVLREDGTLVPVVHGILSLIGEAEIILGTSHLSPAEVMVLVPAARAHGVRHIIVTHPELAISNIPLELQETVALPGVWFERCYVSTPSGEPTSQEAIAAGIRALGPERTILSTDLGLGSLPPPLDGLRAFLAGLLELGVPWRDLQRMTRRNPAMLPDL